MLIIQCFTCNIQVDSRVKLFCEDFACEVFLVNIFSDAFSVMQSVLPSVFDNLTYGYLCVLFRALFWGKNL